MILSHNFQVLTIRFLLLSFEGVYIRKYSKAILTYFSKCYIYKKFPYIYELG